MKDRVSTLQSKRSEEESYAGSKTLRDRVTEVEAYKVRFNEAAKLWHSLFEKERAQFPVAKDLKHYVARSNVGAVENVLDRIIYGPGSSTTLPSGSFLPTPRESMLLLSASWLQVLGIMSGLFEDELDENGLPVLASEQLLSELTQSYAERTARFLTTRWTTWNQWTPDDRQMLGLLCRAQKPGFDLSSLPGADDTDGGIERPRFSVNLRKLAALLRLANACSIHSSFCPIDMRERLRPIGINGPETVFAGLTAMIEDVDFEHATGTVCIRAAVPQSRDLADERPGQSLQIPLTLDLAPVIEFVGSRVQQVLDEVCSVLDHCTNTGFRLVRLELRRTDPAFEKPEDFIRKSWPVQMKAVTCATESACCFALAVYQMIEDMLAEIDWSPVPLRDRVANKCRTMELLQPFNLLGIRLAGELRDFIQSWNEKPSNAQLIPIRDKLVEFFGERLNAGKACSQHAQEILTGVDTVVVYGLSRNVTDALAEADFAGQVLAVPVAGRIEGLGIDLAMPEARFQVMNGEDSVLRDWCAKRKLDLESISPLEIRSRVRNLVNRGKRVVFLAGARAVMDVPSMAGELPRRTCLSTPGNEPIAEDVIRSGGEAFVIAEAGKLATPSEMQRLSDKLAEIDDRTGTPHADSIELLVESVDVTGVIIPG